MNIEEHLSDVALIKLLGQRLMQLRLAKNLTQQQLAEQAGLGLRTVQRLEQGAVATQLSGFVRICRVLGLVEGFDHLGAGDGSQPDGAVEASGPQTATRQRRAAGQVEGHVGEMDLG